MMKKILVAAFVAGITITSMKASEIPSEIQRGINILNRRMNSAKVQEAIGWAMTGIAHKPR